jgi:hypothetical protein
MQDDVGAALKHCVLTSGSGGGVNGVHCDVGAQALLCDVIIKGVIAYCMMHQRDDTPEKSRTCMQAWGGGNFGGRVGARLLWCAHMHESINACEPR